MRRPLAYAILATAVILAASAPFLRHREVFEFDREEDEFDHPEEAAEYYRMMRAPDGKEIPVERYLTALDHLRRMRVYSSARRRFLDPPKDRNRLISLGSWEDLGPGNVGGRTRSMVINPTNDRIIYAGGVAGGVWKTTDGGDSWAPLNDLLPNLSVGSIALDPRSPDTLYVGTGESFAGDGLRGVGIFKSTDGGASFSLLESTRGNTNFFFINKLIVSPVDGNHLYAATQTGIFRSLNGGDTWTQVLSANGMICPDMAIRSDQTSDYVFASCRYNVSATAVVGVIYRNVDAGGTGQWEQVFSDPNMRRTSLAIAPSSQGTVYALAASGETGDFSGGLLGVYRSTANGDKDSWEMRVSNKDPSRLNSGLLTNRQGYFADICAANGVKTFGNQGSYDNVIAVDPLDADIVWAGGIDLFRSDDGGRNWGVASYWNSTPGSNPFAHADHHVIVFHPAYNGDSNQTLYDASDGGIARTNNARARVAAGADTLGCSSVNTQVVWKSLNNRYSVTQFYHGAVFPGGHFYFGGAQDNGTNLGSDAAGGNGWVTLIGGDGGYAAVDPNDATRVYGETQRGTALNWFRRSLNGGKTFAAAMTGITEPAAATNFLFVTPYSMDPSETKRLYLGGKTVWRTNDGAGRWEAASPSFPGGIISTIAIAPSNPKRLLVGTSTGFVHRNDDATTSDASSDWPRVQLRTAALAKIAFDPNNADVAYAVFSTFDSGINTGHVFKTTDGGVTWRNVDGSGDTRIPDIPARSVVVSPIDGNTVYVGTDMGIFVSLDGGETWAREDTQFPTTDVEQLIIDSSNGGPVLYAFTHGRGAWRLRLTDTPACSYKLTAPALPAFGGTYPVRIETGESCSWSAFTQSTSVNLPPPATGKGSGDLQVTIPTNTGTTVVTVPLTVAGETIRLQQERPVFPANNDEPARPFAIAGLPWVGVQDTRTATSNSADPLQPCASNARNSKTVWYSYVADGSGALNLTAQGISYTTGATYGVILSAYELNGNAPGTQLACTAGAPTGTAAFIRATVNVTEGQTYLIEVSGLGTTNTGGYTVLTASR